jgi:dTDP-4-amino-4,6-dideoxygalactose transaminase
MKKIKLIEPVVGKEELEAVKEVLASGWLTEGSKTREFESKIEEYIGVKHAIAMPNCTVALETALRVCGIGKGDEVIVPDFTYPATVDAICLVGAVPILVDVDRFTYNIDMEQIKNAISEKTKAILPVSLMGNPLNPKLYEEFTDFYIIEDAACSLGAEWNGKKVGTFADITCFSFHPRKIITTGEGGMIVTNSDEWDEKIRSYKNFGIKNKEFIGIGTNYKVSDILSAIGVVQLSKINKIINRRIKLASNYHELLRNINTARPPQVDPKAKHTFQTYAVYIEKGRDKIIEELKTKGIETRIGSYAVHLQPAFKIFEKLSNPLTVSESLYRKLLALPMCHNMTFEDQKYVIDSIAERFIS